MRLRTAVVIGAVVLVLAVVAVVVEALTHSGVAMWFGFALVLALTVVIGARFVGPWGSGGGGGGSGCGPGGC